MTTEKKEKRNIDGYEEVSGIRLASRYVVLAESSAEPHPYLVCNIRWDNPFSAEEHYDGEVMDGYVEAVLEFTKRVNALAESIEAERHESGLPAQMLTVADCLQDGYSVDWEGKVIIVRPESLAPEYRSAEHQLALCTGGFGSRPNSRGRAVYVKELYSGKECRYDRQQIAGLADLSKMPAWAVDKLQEYTAEEILPSKTAEAPQKKPSFQEKLKAAQKAAQQSNAQNDNQVKKPPKVRG